MFNNNLFEGHHFFESNFMQFDQEKQKVSVSGTKNKPIYELKEKNTTQSPTSNLYINFNINIPTNLKILYSLMKKGQETLNSQTQCKLPVL